ncbi:MAG TPA: serine hydrolase domain-containing protein [Candidatus Acidoferrum sp.]|nr:serine hydrolase domain-containing protein [Candidatus Acidoferrum sp.]
MLTTRRTGVAAVFVVALLVAAAALARRDDLSMERKVDEVFAAYSKPGSPGCALGVIRDGNFVYKRGYGEASLELGVPIRPESVFYMGSVSKQFTAASVVLAAEQGFLSLDDDVRQYIPELPSYGKTITLRAMLHHTSGLRDIFGLLYLAGRNPEDVHPTSELLDLIVHQKALNFAPGDEYLYSNTNFFLMSVVIRRATGKPLSQFAEENIFKPLGMTHTRFYDDRSVVVAGRIPAYEPRKGGGFQVGWSTNFDKVGDGGLMSSVDDLLLWDRNFYDNKLGKGTLLKELQTQGVLNNGKKIEYGLGLVISRYRGLPVVAHAGSLFGYRTVLMRFPAQRFSVICLCNVSGADTVQSAERIADLYLASQLAKEPPAPGAKVDPHAFAGWYRDAESHAVLQVIASNEDLEAFGEHFKPRDASHFAGPDESEMAFNRTSGGGLRMTLLFKDTTPQVFEPYQAVKANEEDFAQYAGEYSSAEVEATYRLYVKEGKLTLAVNWLEPFALQPTVRDEFQGPYGSAIVFRRDSAGRITGFDAFAGRVRNIGFVKASK